MNRNLLLIAIAAVVLVGIGAGILLVGNGQSPGGLSGAIGPISTNLTLNASACPDPIPTTGNISFTLSGELRDTNDNPLGDRTIALRTASCDNGQCGVLGVEFATTDLNGSFSFAKNEPPTPNLDEDTYVYYGAAFSGDAQYAGCASATVHKPC